MTILRGDLFFLSDLPGSAVELDTDAEAPLWIVYEKPNPRFHYLVTMDVAEGFGGDYTVIHVYLIDESGEQTVLWQVATYSTNLVNHVESGVHAFMAGAWYFNAFLIVEMNNPGMAIVSHLERGFDIKKYPQTIYGYPNCYYSLRFDKRGDEEETGKLGWLTSSKTKEKMIIELAGAILDKRIQFRSKRTINELLGFYWDPEKKKYGQYNKAEDGKPHDDEVIAAALAPQALEAWLKQRPTMDDCKVEVL